MNDKEKKQFKRLVRKVWLSKELNQFVDFLFDLNPEDTDKIKISFEYVVENEKTD